MRLFGKILFLFLIITGAVCKKKCIPKVYSFYTNIIASPDLDTININDTIWMEMNTPILQTDVITGELINFSNATHFSTTIKAARFIGGSISSPGVVDAENDFSFKLITGVQVNNTLPGVLSSVRPVEVNARYILRYGIIPQRIGIYAITISNSGTVRRLNDDCTEAGFNITFANTNQHLYFYEQNRPGYIPSQYERTHMYCFKVK